MRRILVLTCTMLPSVALYGQAPTIQVWISGDVTVTTSDSLTLTAVRVKGRMWRDSIRSGEHDVVFCIAHAKPIASKLNYTGKGRVVYRTPRSGKSAAKGARAATMLPALGVLQADGESPFFLAEGQWYPHPINERSVGNVSTFAIVNLVRHEVRELKGKRQKSDTLRASKANADEHSRGFLGLGLDQQVDEIRHVEQARRHASSHRKVCGW
jgi:hypothetical protein